MTDESGEVVIQVRENGPYVVQGPFRLVDAEGNEWDISGRPRVSLCRCGGSLNKPFCDGTHSKIGFEGASRAVAEAERERERAEREGGGSGDGGKR